MNLTIFDHGLVVLLTVIMPVWGAHSFRRLRARDEAGESIDRIRQYSVIIIMEWLTLGLIFFTWWLNDRSASSLVGGVAEGWRLWTGVALTLVAVGFLVWQSKAVRDDRVAQRRLRASAAHLKLIAPANDRESKLFAGLSVTAGICEETMYRGFLLWYVATWSNIWVGFVVSSLVFGLGHAYQGPGGVIKTAAIGVAFCGLYLLTDSLIPPIVVHAALDLSSGSILRMVFHGSEDHSSERDAGVEISN